MGMEVLRCKSPRMVHKELEMFFIAYNLIRCLMAEASQRHEVGMGWLSAKAEPLAVSMSAMILTVTATMSASLISTTIPVATMSGRAPMTPSPHPTIIAPSPTSPDPEVSWCWAHRGNLDHGRRHINRGRSNNDRGWRDHHRGRKRNSEAYTETNPSVNRGDSQSGQGQNCDCLFHIL